MNRKELLTLGAIVGGVVIAGEIVESGEDNPGNGNGSNGGTQPPPTEDNPLEDTLCHADGVCASLAVRNQNRQVEFLDFGTRVRATITGDIKNIGSIPVQTATLNLYLVDDGGNIVRTLQSTVGPLTPSESVRIERVVEGPTLEMNRIERAELEIISWE